MSKRTPTKKKAQVKEGQKAKATAKPAGTAQALGFRLPFDTIDTARVNPKARVVAVGAGAVDYPGYVIRFAGELVPVEDPSNPPPPPDKRITIGPHGYVLETPVTGRAIHIKAERNDTTTGVPDITITISQED